MGFHPPVFQFACQKKKSERKCQKLSWKSCCCIKATRGKCNQTWKIEFDVHEAGGRFAKEVRNSDRQKHQICVEQ